MTLRPAILFALVSFLIVVVTGCGEPILPPATPTAAVTATPTATPQPTSTPTPTTAPTPTATPLRTAGGLVYADLGLPNGDSYSPMVVAADSGLKQVYVYSSFNDRDGEDTLSVLRAGSLEAVGTVRLGGTHRSLSLASDLAVDASTHRVYAQNADRHALVVVDGASLNILAVVQGTRRMALAAESGRIYVLNDQGRIKCLSTTDYHELASVDWSDDFEPNLMIYDSANDSLYLGQWTLDDKGGLVVLDGATLAKKAEIALSAAPLDLEVDPAANEVYVATNAGVVIVDAATNRPVQGLNLSIASFHPVRSLALDRGQRRLYLSFNAGIVLASGGGLVEIDLATRTVLRRTLTRHFWQDIRFESSDGVLYAVPAMNDALVVSDRQGEVRKRAVLGLRVLDVAVDPASGRVWAIDSGGTLHELDGGNLQELRRLDDLAGAPDGVLEASDLAVTDGSVYVADPDQGDTLLVDSTTMEVRQRLPAAGPLTLDPNGQRLFIADAGQEGIKIFGLGTGKPVGRISISQSTPDGEFTSLQFEPVTKRLYARLRSGVSSSLYRTSWRAYDEKGKTLVTSFAPEYRDIEGLAVVPQAKRVYIAYSGSSDWDKGLVAYDNAGVEQQRLRGVHGPLLASPDGRYLFVLRENGVWVLDREKLEPVALLPLEEPYEQMALDAGGDSLYLRDGARVAVEPVSKLLRDGIRPITQLPESMGLPATTYRSPLFESDSTVFAVLPGEGVYRSLDGGRSWILSSRGLGDVMVIKLQFSSGYAADQTIFATTRNATYVSRDRGQTWSTVPAWAPTLAFVYGDGAQAEIYTMNADGSQIRRLGQNGVRGSHPSWSPDNNWLVFSANRTGSSNIYVVQVDGQGLARATSGSQNDTEPAWSPDGGRIAFTSDRDGRPQLYVMDADGSNPRRLTDSPGADHEPAWSPDSSRLAFTSNRGGQDQVYVLTLSTGQVAAVTSGPARNHSPAWSPDGQWLAFVSEHDGAADIYQVHPDGSALTQVTSAGGNELWPAWSPDGRSLIFASNRSGRLQLYLADLNGGPWRRLRMDPAPEAQPSWIHR